MLPDRVFGQQISSFLLSAFAILGLTSLLFFLFSKPVKAAVPYLPVPADGTYELSFSYPVGRAVPGDFNGDGVLDFVIKSEAAGSSQTYRIEARLSNGTKLWEFDTNVTVEDAYIPMDIALLAWDFDGDGKWEVYFQYRKNGKWWNRIVRGDTGAALADSEAPGQWSDLKSMAVIAYRGGRPRVVHGLDPSGWGAAGTVWMYETYNGSSWSLNPMWSYRNGNTMAHDMFRALDVDQNGSDDEILLGCATLNSNGVERYHTNSFLGNCGGSDQVLVGYFVPSRPNDLVVITGDNDGKHVAAYFAANGQKIWGYDMRDFFSGWAHFHTGWVRNQSDGGKLLVIDRNTPSWMYFEVKDGTILDQGTADAGRPSCSGRPVKWDADDWDDCVGKSGELGRIDVGGPGCEEVWERGGNTLNIQFNTACPSGFASRWSNRSYRQEGILPGSGYSPYWLGGVVIGSGGPPPTPGPTSTPGPSPTPRPTNTPAPPSNTPTPRPTNTPVPTPTPIPGDLDGDRDVDSADYNILVAEFGFVGCGNVADIDGDCDVDVFDYNVMVENFGRNL